MSHFSVVVITEELDSWSVEDKLAPFIEEVEAGDEYAEFSAEFTKPEAERDRMREIDELDQMLKDKKYTTLAQLKEEWAKQSFRGGKVPTQADLNKEFNSKFQIQKRIDDFLLMCTKDFMKEYHGYVWNENKQAFGYWHNPNAKWDWYSIGGRWMGYFKAKAGKRGELGRPGVFDNKPKEGYYDVIKFEDIDWDGIRADAKAHAEKNWKEAEGKNEQDRHWQYGIEKDDTLETYIKREVGWSLKPYAFIDKDGEWHETGTMGWFGVSHDEHPIEYEKEWTALLAGLQPTDVLTIVDCHI